MSAPKRFYVPIRITKTVEIETAILVETESAQEALAWVKTKLDKGETKEVLKKIDNKDHVYEQFADAAEVLLDYGPENGEISPTEEEPYEN